MDISKRAMLALPSISVWTARRYDRKISKEVADHHDVDIDRAGRYNKCLINVKDALYNDIKKIEGDARRWHEEHTLPWAQDGARILAVPMFEEYSAQMSLKREAFEHAVEEFLRAYPGLHEAAKRELNGAYHEDDYPSVDELRRKFRFSISIMPVPTASDFRVEDLDAEKVDRMRRDINEEVTQTVKDAERKRWERLFSVVQHAVDKLSEQKAIFHDSMIENIKEACETLPKLALTDDADFDSVVEETSKKLANLDPKRLRTDIDARADAARKANQIAKKMGYFMR